MSDKNLITGMFTTKGGTGKTTVALNLAVALGKKGRTLLVDIDSNYTITAILKISSVKLYDVLTGSSEKPKNVFGIDIISSDARTKSIENSATLGMVDNLMKMVKNYDYVVFDYHNAPSPLILMLIKYSNLTLVPVIPSMASMGAYIHTRKILGRAGVKYLGFANLVRKGLFGIAKEDRDILREIERKGNWSGVVIPYDPHVKMAEKMHRPVVEAYPRSPFSKAVAELVKKVEEVI